MAELEYGFDNSSSILLGDYLDLLLNAASVKKKSGQKTSKFLEYAELVYTAARLVDPSGKPEGLQRYEGGIRLPHKANDYDVRLGNDDGSGNIVIVGEPGVGKSTLAFQIAAECTSALNNGIAIYYSIDITRSQLIKSMCITGDDCNTAKEKGEESREYANISRMNSFQGRDANDSDENLRDELKKALQAKPGQSIRPQILLPMLSPRGVSLDHRYAQDLFRERFAELELMLRAICAYNSEIEGEKKKTEGINPLARNPMVKLVVIDSINMLGEIPLTREQVSLVFELFESYGVLGLFTLGENTAQTDAEAVNSSTVKYIADLVLQLKREEHNNYSCMTMTAVKSRFIKTIIGAHPYKITESQITRYQGNELKIQLKKRVNVMATLHDIIPGTEGSPHGERWFKKDDNLFGIPMLNKVLPDQFNFRKGDSSQTVTLMGGSGLFKSDLAVNAILNGLVADTPVTGLIIRMSDRESFRDAGARLEEHVLEKILRRGAGKSEAQTAQSHLPCIADGGEVTITMEEFDEEDLIETIVPIKRKVSGWRLIGAAVKSGLDAAGACEVKYKGYDITPKMLEVVFKSGALLPEEFIADVMMLIIKHKVRLIAFHDIKYIGTSFPFLIDSGTSGTLFISAFIHIMRNYGVDVIMLSSECGYGPSDFEMNKTVALSDALLRFDRKPGDGFSVTIAGEGQMIHNRRLDIQVLGGKPKAIRCSFEIHEKDKKDRPGPGKTAELDVFSIKAAGSSD